MSEQASWKRLGAAAPEALADARFTLHWAARIVGAADALSPAAEAEPGLEWMESLGALVGPPLGGADGRSVAVRVADLCLLVVNRDGEEEGQLALDNLSAENALMWLKFTLGTEEALELDKTGLPPHALEKGSVFDVLDDAAFGEVARWYGNAAAFLDDLRADVDDSSEVRCSTITLELATSIEVEPGGEGEEGKRMVVGMRPGGPQFPAPHWFVRPLPQPESAPGEALPGGGTWQSGDWVAAVLPAAAVIAAGDASAQRELVDEFVKAAIEQARGLLG